MIILNRPMEILIITGLNVAVGVILLLNGLGSALVLPVISLSIPDDMAAVLLLVGNIMTIAGSVKLPLAIAFFGSAAGLFLGKGSAWTITRALQFAGIALGFAFLYGAGSEIATLGLYTLGMAIGGIVIGYLYTPEVREFYGKQEMAPSQRKHSRRKRKETITEDEDAQPSAAEVE